MDTVIEMDGFMIDPVFTEREVNFVVSDREGYLFRLVPDLEGFSLSPMDRALNVDVNPVLAEQISSGIASYFS